MGSTDDSRHDLVRDLDTGSSGVDPWRPLPAECRAISMQKPKSEAELEKVGALWNGRRDVGLQLWGYATENLEFLRWLPGLERLDLQSPIIRTLDGLRHVAASLRHLSIAATTVRLSLQPVASCTGLESLDLQRQKQDFDRLASLPLVDLRLSGASLLDLSPLVPFAKLRSLVLGFSKAMNLDLLDSFAELETFRLIKLARQRDLSALALGRRLRRIELEWLPHVEQLPDLSGLVELEAVEITTMKSLRDVSAIAKAPRLRSVALWDCSALVPEDFACLLGHPTLERVRFGVGRLRDNDIIASMMGKMGTGPIF